MLYSFHSPLSVKITVFGFYGEKNAGDEAILLGLLNTFKTLGVRMQDISVSSADPAETEELYGVGTVPQHFRKKGLMYLTPSNIFRVLSALRSDLSIIGGGALLHERTLYNLPVICGLSYLSSKLSRYSLMLGIGAEQVNSFVGKLMLKLLNSLDFVSARTSMENDNLLSKGVKSVSAADLAFNIQKDEFHIDRARHLLEQFDRPWIGVTYSSWFRSEDYYKLNKLDLDRKYAQFGRFLSKVRERTGGTLFLVPTLLKDWEYSARLRKYAPFLEVLPFFSDPRVVGPVFKHLDFLVGMRLHSLIFATIFNTPFYPIVYDQKVLGFLKDIKYPAEYSKEMGFSFEQFSNAYRKRTYLASTLRSGKRQLIKRGRVNSEAIEEAIARL